MRGARCRTFDNLNQMVTTEAPTKKIFRGPFAGFWLMTELLGLPPGKTRLRPSGGVEDAQNFGRR